MTFKFDQKGKIMTFFVRRCLMLFVVGEMFVFFMVYCFGPNSLKSLYEIKHLKVQTEIDIVNLQKEIIDLQQKTKINQTDFAKEKIAREQLLMKKDNETVYFKTTALKK
jgi:cell division protein FtsB